MTNPGLETLLDLDGQILVQEDGSWIKIEARLVKETDNRPHGIKYSLTLHGRKGDEKVDHRHSAAGQDA